MEVEEEKVRLGASLLVCIGRQCRRCPRQAWQGRHRHRQGWQPRRDTVHFSTTWGWVSCPRAHSASCRTPQKTSTGWPAWPRQPAARRSAANLRHSAATTRQHPFQNQSPRSASSPASSLVSVGELTISHCHPQQTPSSQVMRRSFPPGHSRFRRSPLRLAVVACTWRSPKPVEAVGRAQLLILVQVDWCRPRHPRTTGRL